MIEPEDGPRMEAQDRHRTRLSENDYEERSISCQVQSSATDTIFEIESRGRCALASGEIAERVIQVSVQP